MKIIDINLIGDLAKNPKKLAKLKQKRTSRLDAATRYKITMILVGTAVVFFIAFGMWAYAFISIQNAKVEIDKLSKEYDVLKPKLEQSNENQKNIINQKKVLELKLLAKKQIESGVISWYSVLSDITRIVPEKMKITEINKMHSRGRVSSKLEIKGQINADKKGALKLISFLVLNINERISKKTLMQNASIKTVKYDENLGLYDFSVVAKIVKPRKKIAISKPYVSKNKKTAMKIQPKVKPERKGSIKIVKLTQPNPQTIAIKTQSKYTKEINKLVNAKVNISENIIVHGQYRLVP